MVLCTWLAPLTGCGPTLGGALEDAAAEEDARVPDTRPADLPAADRAAADTREADRAPAETPPADAAADRPAPAPLPACTQPPCITVQNNCTIPLWTHAVAPVPIDEGRVRKLEPGGVWQYAALPPFGGGRVYAYYKEPASKQDVVRLVSDHNQFVEMTIDRDPPSGAWAQNYNISYVDYLSLPVSMKGSAASCAETRCGSDLAAWTAKLKTCPTDLRNAYGDLATCTASYNYCLTPDGAATYDTTRPYCHKMQEAHGYPGTAVYGGTFAHPAEDVAFWDGVAVAGDADESHYYEVEPYNHYARWIHRDLGCGRVYAFSTDDHQDKAGFVRCVAPALTVVWCPPAP